MNINNKYIIGTHVMFYEIDMAKEHIESIINASNRVSNRENITINLLFNLSEYFEKVDTNQISKNELRQKFIDFLGNELSNFVLENLSSCVAATILLFLIRVADES